MYASATAAQLVRPALELRCVFEKHAFEKWTCVEARRAFEIIRGDTLLELGHVADEDIAIHSELRRPEHEIIDGQLAPENR